MEIHIVDYKRVKGSSYIPLPEFIKRKNAIINIKNKDKKCFLWSVLRYLHPKKSHGERLADLREYENDLNFKGINFPVKLKDITKCENQNPSLPGINVFSVNDNNKIYTLKNNEKDPIKSIDLFLFSKGEKQHYSLIKNFSRLVRSQITSDTTLHICENVSLITQRKISSKNICFIVRMKQLLLKCQEKTLFSISKIISKNFQFLLSFMLILNVSQNQSTLSTKFE